MLPKEKLNKMKTFKDKNPIGSELDKKTIERFITQQEQILNLLDKSKEIDLNKTKTAISISKLIKLPYLFKLCHLGGIIEILN